MGTANIDEFQRYKVEWGPGLSPMEDEWVSVSGREPTEPVVNGVLDTWDTSPLPSGDYTLRLTVVRLDYNYPEPRCTVHVKIP